MSLSNRNFLITATSTRTQCVGILLGGWYFALYLPVESTDWTYILLMGDLSEQIRISLVCYLLDVYPETIDSSWAIQMRIVDIDVEVFSQMFCRRRLSIYCGAEQYPIVSFIIWKCEPPREMWRKLLQERMNVPSFGAIYSPVIIAYLLDNYPELIEYFPGIDIK